MKKLFISQPMRGLSDEEILRRREELKIKAQERLHEELEVIDSYFYDEPEVNTIPLYYLGKSIQLLSTADVAIFADGYRTARGCRIEHECALEYEIPIILEKDL